ncbi:hypothetical protein ACFPK9_12815 [Rubritalea spongiae]|uniref:Uncharacterized protein n=1 Tax=Rubritalea spongiae TaxID=430797 RepID=A0ABW5E3Q2_9BACT
MIRLSISLLSSLLSLAHGADSSVVLTNGDRLTGEIQQLRENGECIMQLSTTQPEVTIKADMLNYIEFDASSEKQTTHKENIILTNGDSLPCEILGLKEGKLRIGTSYAGAFLIPRGQIESISFNNSASPQIYQGPNRPSEWDQLSHWEINEQNLQTNSNAEASIELPIPSNFVIRFQAKWEGERPRFKLYLCSDAQLNEDLQSAYFIDFNTSNIQVYRSTSSRANQRIGEIPIRLREFSKRSASIEVKVDRKLQQLTLEIDGEEIGTFDDTEISPPSGKWTIFEANMQNALLSISNINVTEAPDNYFTGNSPDDPIDPQHDTFFDKQGGRAIGKLIDIKLSEQETTLHFENQHSKQSLSIPIAQAHTIFLASEKSTASQRGNYLIEMHGGGKLEVLKLSLNENFITTTHPILGEIELSRAPLTSLKKLPTANAQ